MSEWGNKKISLPQKKLWAVINDISVLSDAFGFHVPNSVEYLKTVVKNKTMEDMGLFVIDPNVPKNEAHVVVDGEVKARIKFD